MPEFRVAVDPETADALQTEVDLLGFGDSDEYLAWIVENRAAIEQGTESAELLDAYRDRLVALEERLAEAGVDPATVDAATEPISDAQPATTSSDALESSSGESESAGDHSSTTAGDRSSATTSVERGGVDTIETSTDRSLSIQTGGTGSGEPDAASSDAASARPSSAGSSSAGSSSASAAGSDEPRAASDGGVSAQSESASTRSESVSAQSEITSMHLRPERVQRVQEDPVTEDADSLKDVETDRLDELSRRAVAETRKQLDREVETGLDYSSTTALDESGVRPGEDLADLDALDVPGRTEGLVEARRVVVGRALAYLHDVGRARRSDFVDELFEDWPAGYESSSGWWRCVREALKQVDAVDGGQVWRYED